MKVTITRFLLGRLVAPEGTADFGLTLRDWPAVGTVVDLPDGLARSLVTDGYAEVAPEPEPEPVAPAFDEIETATAPVAEKRGPGRPKTRK